MNERENLIDAWSRYWSSGFAHSCVQSFQLDGDDGLSAFWRQTFSGLRQSASVVDLASGNGALLQLASELNDRDVKGWRMTGVDLAYLSPSWHDPVRDQAVAFLGQTAMEATGLPAGQTDLLVSQFGVEYGESDKVQAECLRLMGLESSFAFVIHHDQSIISRVAKDDLAAQNLLLSDTGLLASTAAMLPHLSDVRSGRQPTTQSEEARAQFNVAVCSVQKQAGILMAPDLLHEALDFIHQMVVMVEPGNRLALLGRLQEYTDDIARSRLRTREQIACALSADGLTAFLAPFHEARIETNVQELKQSGHLVAWGVVGRKALNST